MEWRNRRTSDNVEDARGSGMRAVGVGGGIGTMVLAFVLWKFLGVDPSVVMNAGQAIQQNRQASGPVQETAEEAQTRQFVSTVLADTEDTWQKIFAERGSRYQPPKLVLFSGMVQSACGTAQSAMGPFYCPADQKVYLDMSFFRDMRRQLGISGEQQNSGNAASDQAGDFAQAYVIAHEVGHHVQNLMGIAEQMQRARQNASEAQANALSVRQELQADCLAGVWANQTQQRVNFLQAGDIEEALNAATQIGDDRLQSRSQGYVVPESFTHGTSAQRMHWFQQGFQSGNIDSCDTSGRI